MTTFTTSDRIYAEKDGSFTINCVPKPLPNTQILALALCFDITGTEDEKIAFARLIERAHGIK